MAVVGNLRSRSTEEGPLRTRWIHLERQDPLIDLSVLAWPDSARLLTELDGLADLSGDGLWRPRPVKSRLSRPDVSDGARSEERRARRRVRTRPRSHPR